MLSAIPTFFIVGSLGLAGQVYPWILNCDGIKIVESAAISITTHNVPDDILAERVCITETDISDHLIGVCLCSFIAKD